MTVALAVILCWGLSTVVVCGVLWRATHVQRRMEKLVDRAHEVLDSSFPLDEDLFEVYRAHVEEVLQGPSCQACMALARLVAAEHCLEWSHGRAIIAARIRNGQIPEHTHTCIV